MSVKLCLFASVFFLALALTAHARAEDQAFTYLSPETLPPQLLAPPPKEGGKIWRQEIADVLVAQEHISATDLAALRNEQHLQIESLTSIIGQDFTAQRFPKSFALLDHTEHDANGISEADKKFWHMRRPYLTDKNVKLLVDPVDASPSYPSGHTCDSRVTAEILGLLYPEKLDALRAKAAAIAHHRVEAGVHYPGDIRGGETLAMLIIGALMDNDDFQGDLAAARKEIAETQ